MVGFNKSSFSGVFFTFLIWCLPFGVSVANAAETPDKVSGNATARVIKLLQDNRNTYEKKPDQFYRDVEQVIDPVIAFDEMARGVMGKYAHRASDAQIKEFTGVFRSSLIHFYSKAVLTFDSSQLSLGKVDPVSPEILKEYDSGKSRSVPVSLKIKAKDAEYSISYSMMKEGGEWKVRNIIVEGINIGIQFRNQFGEAMNRYKKVEVAIEKWPELMQQTEKSQEKELREKGKDKS